MYLPVTLTLTIYILPLAVTRIVGSVPEEIGRCYTDVIREDPQDCHHYIQCSAGMLYRYYCGHESVFDPFTRTCVAPITAMGVSCSNGKYSRPRQEFPSRDVDPVRISKEGNEMGSRTERTGVLDGTDRQRKNNKDLADLVNGEVRPEKQRAVLGVSDENKVRCLRDGYFGDKNDCRKFYRCFSGSIHVFACPEGMAFDDETAACDFPPFGDGCFHQMPKRERTYKVTGRRKITAVRDQTVDNLKLRASNREEQVSPDNQEELSERTDAELTAKEHQRPEYQKGQFQLADIRRVPNGHNPRSQKFAPRQQSAGVEKIRPKIQYTLVDKLMNRFPSKFDMERNDWNFATTSEFNQPHQIPAPEQPTESNPPYISHSVQTNSPTANEDLKTQKDDHLRSNENSYIYKYHDSTADSSKESEKKAKEKAPTNLDSKQGPTQVEAPEEFQEVSESKQNHPAVDGPLVDAQLAEYDTSQQFKKKNKMNFSYLGNLFYTGKFPCRRNGYYRDHKDCTRFYQCSNTMAYHLECNKGLVFNIRDGICDWPHKVPECRARSRSFDRHVAYLQSLTGETIGDDTNDPTFKESNSFSKEEYICIPGAKRPDPTNCEAFFSCTDGRSEFHFKCPDEMAFHAGDRECVDRALVAGCREDPGENSNSSETVGTGPSAARGLQAQRSPHEFGIAPGQVFRCPSPKGLFRDPTDCSLYYACTEGQASILSCPSGFVFNQNRNLCDLPTNVPVCMTRLMLENRHTAQGGRYRESEQGNHRHEENGLVCTSDGVFPQPRDCTLFVECHRGVEIEMRCSPGLAFHDIKQACVPLDYVPRCFPRGREHSDRSRHFDDAGLENGEGLGRTDRRAAEAGVKGEGETIGGN